MMRPEPTGPFAWFLVVLATAVDAQIGTGPQPDRAESGRFIVSPNQLSQKQSLEYNLRDNYCWLLAHTSVRAGNEIVINDGMAKYIVSARLNGSTTSQEVEVPDLNAWTMSLPLDKDFPVNEPPLQLWHPRNSLTHPPANRGGLWSNGTHIFSVGGHYYNASRYMDSYYAVPQDSIPPFEIWAGDVQRRQWAKVDHVATPGERLDRTVSGAAMCVVKEGKDVNKCYYLGGYKSTRTSSQLPDNWALSQRAMLEFNPETLTIRNDTKSTDGYGDPDMGYQFGTLHHIPVGCGSGILVSLMAEQSPLNLVSDTDDDLRGPAVNTTTVMVYDIDSRTWYHQKTARGLEDERPPPRTRYCGDVVYSESTKSWDLWIYGGQFVDHPDDGMEDVHVLTMPKFQWVRLDLKTPPGVPSPKAIRGHTCHAVNSQLLVLGGTARGLEVNQVLVELRTGIRSSGGGVRG
ncbi:hypothetical protein EX30DRAFT_258051 [Ascodesmis nigricans]|uniref:Galactose oxidase n=1 Tax=Ascodesmis nigricans TaxID=341454 RepID=A0A4S2MHH1_9PEZI|nr:hypothetical protein EX30DRAFT_258051 [Ascodesmis nigricans]